MTKSKYNFIKNMLVDKDLDQNQRERLFALASKELDNERSLQERVKKIEDIVFCDKLKTNTKQAKYSRKNKVNYRKHVPKEMVKFLYQFSSDDKYKWFTHEPDLKIDEFNYLSLLNSIKNKLYYPNLNYATTNFIQNFLFNTSVKTYYPPRKISLTYGSKEIIERLENGESPFKIKVDDIYFKNIIECFKRAIEFRIDYGEENKFSYLVKDFFLEHLSLDFTETYTEGFNKIGKTINTYIDTNNFFSGISKIIAWINHFKSISSELEIDLRESDDFYTLIIFHKKSFIPRRASHEKLKGTSGDFETLRKYWFSIVDFEIHADLKVDDKLVPYIITALDKNTGMDDNNNLSENSIVQQNDVEKIDGLKYCIIIYKTKNL